jgi:DNA polymerase III subunit alpha
MFKDFTKYDMPTAAGVLLPNIIIEKKYYDLLNIPDTTSNFDFLRNLAHKGVKDKGIDKLPNKQVYYDRAKFELSILNDLGFIDYILLNWDILKYCHENDIPTGPGRGSAAGSLILFLIGVTKVDPIKYDLYFERFVSKSRARKIEHNGITYLDGSLLADVDNDIAYERRKEVIQFIEKKYVGKTCKILTMNTLSAKLCIKECGKIVEELDETTVNLISDIIPKKFGKVAPLSEAYQEVDKFREFADQYPEVYKIAKKLENLNKNTGVHPSGIAISHHEMSEIMPVQKTGDGDLVSGYDMNNVAELTVKFDILGLRTLSVVYDVCKQTGIDISVVDLNSELIYQNLQSINTPQGLFQIEADTNFRVCQKVKPKNLEELSAVVAIARPGAIEFLDNYARYVETSDFQSVNPFFDDVLSYTGGIPLYQEQLMKMAVKVGFTLDEAEQLRRIVGKKKVDQIEAWKQKIEDKIKENKLDNQIGEILWKVAEDSANYSFNKSHSISYAILAAWTIYLKFNYPQQFFLSLLKSTEFEPDPHEVISNISKELPYFDIRLLQPDLSKSDIHFTIQGRDIRYGLNAIKGVSTKVLESLLEFRQGEFTNKYEIFMTAKESGLNIGVLSALIQAGTLDSFSTDRCRLVLEAQTFNILTDREKIQFINIGQTHNYDILNSIKDVIKNSSIGDDNKKIMSEKRFETFKKKYAPYKEIYEKNVDHQKFANWYFEKKLLGYSYSYNIRDIFKDNQDNRFTSTLEFNSSENNTNLRIVGWVSESEKRTSRNNNKYIKVCLQDELGNLTAMLMDGRDQKMTNYIENGGCIPKKDSIVVLTGRKANDTMFLDNIFILDEKIYMKLSELK